jgi:hypothetical protein
MHTICLQKLNKRQGMLDVIMSSYHNHVAVRLATNKKDPGFKSPIF